MGFQLQPYNAWLQQAKRTLGSIKNDIGSGDFNWACFKAQQAAEYALKAFLYGKGLPAFGHSVSDLATKITSSISGITFDSRCLADLDKLYIPTRYADAFPAGSPYAYYAITDAEKAVKCAEGIILKIEEHVQNHEITSSSTPAVP
jgi:HEPN domain-containing protein